MSSSAASQAEFRFTRQQDAQFDPTAQLQAPSASAVYFPQGSDQHEQQQQPSPSQVPGIAFDLNAVGDEDDDGQMQQIYKEGSDGQVDVDEVDRRSVYVGNVDYGTTPPELQHHFKNCGAINRITILVDRFTGHPKGYAYIEFQDESAIPNAVLLNESTFRDRQLKVTAKRKNLPGYAKRAGRGGSSRGGGYSPYMGGGGGLLRGGGMRGAGRGRGRGALGYFPRYRGRGARGGVAPY